jgi:exodeoxyribonuclease VII small subunit
MGKKTEIAPKTFEEALVELERILADIEGGQVGLQESLAKYERGTFLIRHCRAVLSAAEQQIEILSKAADGTVQSQPDAEANQG